MNLTVVIPSRNAANLAACVRAVRQHDPGLPIIVVDDGVDWVQYIGLEPANAQALMNAAVPGEKPFIFARNANLGMEAAGDDDVILLNDDAQLENYCGFSLLQSAWNQSHGYGIIGAVTNLTGQPLQMRRPITGTPRDLREVPHIAFVCVFIPRRTINQVGYLDERYICGYEDRDYCEMVSAAGLKIGVHDGCFVDHASLVSTVRGPSGKGYDRAGAQTFADKWKGVTA